MKEMIHIIQTFPDFHQFMNGLFMITDNVEAINCFSPLRTEFVIHQNQVRYNKI